MILNFDLERKKNEKKVVEVWATSLPLFCRTSPRWCSQSSPGGWIKHSTKLIDK